MRVDSLAVMTRSRLRTIETAASTRAAAATLATGDAVSSSYAIGRATRVISKSDLVRHLARSGSTKAGAAGLMTRELVSCRPDDDVRAIWQEMTARRLQNLPVLDQGARPIGILDVCDAMRAILAREELEEQALAELRRFADLADQGIAVIARRAALPDTRAVPAADDRRENCREVALRLGADDEAIEVAAAPVCLSFCLSPCPGAERRPGCPAAAQ